MFGRIMNLGYTTTLFAHNVRFLQITKRLGPKIHQNKRHLSIGFMDIITATVPEGLKTGNTFYNYLLSIDAYSNIPKLYGMDKITTEEVMDRLDML